MATPCLTTGALDPSPSPSLGLLLTGLSTHSAAHCRENSLVSTQTTAQPICNGEAHLFFDLQAWGSQPAHLSLDTYNTWLATRPPHKRMLSPVFMAGFGLHNRLDSGTAVLGALPLSPPSSLRHALTVLSIHAGFIRPFLALASQAFPRPLGLWLATHAPAPGKPAAWAEAQDAAHVLAYNEVVAGALEALAGGEVEGLVGERGMTEVSWYCATDGAESYDGELAFVRS